MKHPGWTLARSLGTLLFLASGCSVFQGSLQSVTIDTTVPHADIFINGTAVGPSPAKTTVRRGKRMTVMARKEGYEPAIQTVACQLSGTGYADIIGAYFCLFPGLGLLTPGAWDFEPDYILIPLVPVGNSTNAPPPTPATPPR